MEAVLIGALSAGSVAMAMLFWTLLVRPGLVLSALFRRDADDTGEGFGWPEPDPATLRAARWACGVILVSLTFLCGAATTFLLAT